MATGGAQRVLLDQASWFSTNGHRINVAFLYDRDGLYTRWQDSYPFPIYNLNAFQDKSGVLRQTFFIFRGLQHLWKLLRQGRFDVVETFTLDSNLFALPVAWLAGVPVRMATNHGWAKNDSLLKRISHNLLLKLGVMDVLVAVTEELRSRSIREGARPERVLTIPNGIQLLPVKKKSAETSQKTLSIPAGYAFLLSVGRLVHEKAYEVLIQAIDIVVKEYPNMMLAIAGSGVLEDELRRLIEKLHLDDKIRLLGNRHDVHDLMANADVFVMSSRSEGMPMALLEAMGFGLPVVITRVGGLEEVVEDQTQGLLVPPEDPQELAKAILKLLHDPVLCSNMGKNARQRIEEKYTTERMCRQYERTMLALWREKRK
ncbi:MAG TPA: GT4 family glycosyltransferase PelF [Anaerolineales bacterium]|nr:GT4 family glycosyltransferase PelF [Anaerolineales bacterium]